MSNDCQFRLDSRVRVALPVRVTYRYPDQETHTEDACACDVSRLGARIVGLQVLPRVGDDIEVRYGDRTAQFRVMWKQGGHLGAQALQEDPRIWEPVGPLAELQGGSSSKPAERLLIIKILAPTHYLGYLRRLNNGEEEDQENTVFVCFDPQRPNSFRALAPANQHMAPAATKKIEEFMEQRLELSCATGSVLGQEASDHQFFVSLLSQPSSWERNSVVLQDSEKGREASSDLVHGITRGTGQLTSRSSPSQKYKVEFMFEIVTELVSRARDRWASGKASGWGEVSSLGGRELAPGDYDLETSDGEILHVKKVHGRWMIV